MLERSILRGRKHLANQLLDIKDIVPSGSTAHDSENVEDDEFPVRFLANGHRIVCNSVKINQIAELNKYLVEICGMHRNARESRAALATRSVAKLVTNDLNFFTTPFARVASCY